MSNAAIFRLQLFKASETFIVEQARTLQRYTPFLVGKQLFQSPPPDMAYWCPSRSNIRLRLGTDILGMMKPYAQAIAARKCPIIHAHFGVDALYALNIARTLDVPLVTTLHGFDVTSNRASMIRSLKPAWVRYGLLQKRLMQEGSLFICVSEFIRRAALAHGFPEKKLVRHYIGTDTQLFSRTNPPENPPIVLHVARLVEKKGTRYLISAFAQARKACPEAKLVIIGDGLLRPELEAQASALGLGRSVSFLGARPYPEVREWMARSSIFVLPSVTAESGDSEGLGMVLLEAAASGLAIIGTTHGGIPEAVIDGRTGILVPEKAVAPLADNLGVLLADKNRRDSLGAAARLHVEKTFNLSRQTALLEDLYDRVCRVSL